MWCMLGHKAYVGCIQRLAGEIDIPRSAPEQIFSLRERVEYFGSVLKTIESNENRIRTELDDFA